VGDFDGLHPSRPRLGVGPHGLVCGWVGGRPLAEPSLTVVDELGRRQGMGIDPDDDTSYLLLPPRLVPMWSASWPVLPGAGRPLLEPRAATAPAGHRPKVRRTDGTGGRPEESVPPGTWTESGHTPPLPKVSSSPAPRWTTHRPRPVIEYS